MTHPISVQIITLNEEANIRACLETVLANEPAEIVVIDGGSTDRTVEIARELGVTVLTPGVWAEVPPAASVTSTRLCHSWPSWTLTIDSRRTGFASP